jgi:hypothetical protein
MAPTAHAMLGASSAHRWLACTPSARLCAELKDTTSSYAEAGTLAHAVSEYYLNCYIHPPKIALPKNLTENQYYNAEMAEYCLTYADYVWEEYKAICREHPEAVIMTEQRVDYSKYVPEGFGTADVSIAADGILEIIDYKYGTGVQVYAENNPQIRLYALGVFLKYAFMYDNVDMIKMVIYQPRIDNICESVMSTKDLISWAEDIVKPRAKLAYAGEGELVTGEHCRFCGVKATCRKRAEENLAMAKFEFAPPKTLDNDEIAGMLGDISKLSAWAKDVDAYALSEALNGAKFPGYKLVSSRGRRFITDDVKAEESLIDSMYVDIYKPQEMKSLTELEKQLGKGTVNDVIGDLINKAAGKPTLVPESDKRPEMQSTTSAQDDFKED